MTFPARALPVLPPEIILSIIRQSIAPPTSYTAVASRYPILLVYSLVCRAWRSFAQAELFAHVLLEDAAQARRFTDACTRSGALGRRTVSLRLGRTDVEYMGAEASALFEPVSAGLVPLVREAWVTGISPFSMSFFRESLELHTLGLHEVEIYEPTKRSYQYLIPNLRHLSAPATYLVFPEDTLPSASMEHLALLTNFLANALPPLESFHSHDSYAVTSDGRTLISLDFISGKSSRCHTLSIDTDMLENPTVAYWAPRLPQFQALAHLAFVSNDEFHRDEVEALLAVVPTELVTLRILYVFDLRAANTVEALVVQILDLGLPCLRKLRQLVIFRAEETTDLVDTDSLSAERRLGKRCAELGVDLLEHMVPLRPDADAPEAKWQIFDEGW